MTATAGDRATVEAVGEGQPLLELRDVGASYGPYEALFGVSLTVNTVQDVGFSVLIIPHTLNVTTLGGWHAGGEVNLEVDLMARYAARLSEMK